MLGGRPALLEVEKAAPGLALRLEPPRPGPWTHFFLSELSVSGGMPTIVTVACSALRGAAITKGSSLQRRFFVCRGEVYLDHGGKCTSIMACAQVSGPSAQEPRDARVPGHCPSLRGPRLLPATAPGPDAAVTSCRRPSQAHVSPPASAEQDPSPRPPTLTEHTKDLSRCLLSRLKEAGLENSATSGVPCGCRAGSQGRPERPGRGVRAGELTSMRAQYRKGPWETTRLVQRQLAMVCCVARSCRLASSRPRYSLSRLPLQRQTRGGATG